MATETGSDGTSGIFRLIGGWLGRSASIVALLVAWEVLARAEVVSAFLLPALSVVLVRVWQDLLTGGLAVDVGLTLYRSLAGFALSGLLGVTVGILIARTRAGRWFFDPLVSVGFPAPKIAFLPVFILWFGLFDGSKILMCVFAAVFPVIVATWAGTEGVDKYTLWSARNLGASQRQLLWEIVLPAALPQIITGLQVALPICLIVTIVSEMYMGGAGLGGAMLKSARFADSPGVFAGIVQIAVAGFFLVKGIEWARRRLLAWHPEAQQSPTF